MRIEIFPWGAPSLQTEQPEGLLLSQILDRGGVPLPRYCGGKGTCGKCKVRAEGALSPWTEAERNRLTPQERQNHIRLACQCRAMGDCRIELLAPAGQMEGLTGGKEFFPAVNPVTGTKECFAAAVDIGTTTVAAYLYRMPEGRKVAESCRANPQAVFGADVLSRIEAWDNGHGHALQKSIRDTLQTIAGEWNVPVEAWVITGNTSMLHLLTGKNPHSIAVAPFQPESLFGEWVQNVYFPRCISAYVGADITTAIVASGMLSTSTALLADIGTNGELVLKKNGSLFCCSTAAGPALEGAGISMGMPALQGAICRVWTAPHRRIQYQTVGNGPPVGICGSGLVDAVACMLEENILDETGRLDAPFPVGDSPVVLTPEDIRNLQLAKAAIRAGIDTLLQENGLSCAGLDAFFLAGGFGNNLNLQSCIRIGLFPPELSPRQLRPVGNAAGVGACMLLHDRELLAKSEQIARSAAVTELATNPIFLDAFVERMLFE